MRANAETPADAKAARKFGAEGIGLARTEHMFFEGERIVAVREMILADSADGRKAALAKLLPMQRDDFKELFEIMAGLPVTIRLLDPPLHEFLPHSDAEIAHVASAMGADPSKLRKRAQELSEFNPMLGFRGVRLGVVFPEIVDMQARAIFEAAIAAAAETGEPAQIEIMVPLAFSKAELDLIKRRVDETARRRRGGDGPALQLSHRRDDRIAARDAAGRRHRADGGIPLLWHQRFDANDAGHFARRRGRVSSAPMSPRASCRRTPS